jgi:hypothetical protein
MGNIWFRESHHSCCQFELTVAKIRIIDHGILELERIFKKRKTAGHRWLTPVILATQEAEIRHIVHKTLS